MWHSFSMKSCTNQAESLNNTNNNAFLSTGIVFQLKFISKLKSLIELSMLEYS